MNVFGRIYLITNTVNSKRYIGQTRSSALKRWRSGHCSEARNGETTLICSAIRKYGQENFTVRELAVGFSLDDLNRLEVDYIRMFGTLKPHGYNLDEGGNSRLTHPDSRRKLSLAMRGNTNGRFCKGFIKSEETRLKLSIARKGRPSNRRGAKHMLESRAKMSASHRGVPIPPETRRNMCIAQKLRRAKERAEAGNLNPKS